MGKANSVKMKAYLLLNRGEIVYVGVTSDLRARVLEHELQGKKFTRVEAISAEVNRNEAMEKEAKFMRSYMAKHDGRTPMYNERPAAGD